MRPLWRYSSSEVLEALIGLAQMLWFRFLFVDRETAGMGMPALQTTNPALADCDPVFGDSYSGRSSLRLWISAMICS